MKKKILNFLGTVLMFVAVIGNGTMSAFGWYQPEKY